MRVEVTTKQLLLYLWNYYRIYRDSFAEYISDESRRLFLLGQVARSCRHSVRAIRVVETGERARGSDAFKTQHRVLRQLFRLLFLSFLTYSLSSQPKALAVVYVKDESWIRKLKCAVERWPRPTAFWASPISSSYTHTHCVEKVGNQLIARIIWWLTHSRLKENPTKFTAGQNEADVSYNRAGVYVDYINPRGFLNYIWKYKKSMIRKSVRMT